MLNLNQCAQFKFFWLTPLDAKQFICSYIHLYIYILTFCVCIDFFCGDKSLHLYTCYTKWSGKTSQKTKCGNLMYLAFNLQKKTKCHQDWMWLAAEVCGVESVCVPLCFCCQELSTMWQCRQQGGHQPLVPPPSRAAPSDQWCRVLYTRPTTTTNYCTTQ